MRRDFVPATGVEWLLGWYDPLVARFTGERKFKQHLLDQADLRGDLRLLDVGCGSGTLLALAKERRADMRLTGVDIDVRMLDQARKKLEGPPSDSQSPSHCGNSTLKLLHASAADLPFPSASFDVVLSTLVFHHLLAAEKRAAVDEMRRVLAPEGKLLLADFGRPSHLLAACCFLSVRLLDGWRRTACNVAGRLPQILIEAGLSNVRESMRLETCLGTIRCYEAIKA